MPANFINLYRKDRFKISSQKFLFSVESQNFTINSSFYFIFLPLALAFGFHTDPSNWGLFLLTAITWVKFKPKINRKNLYLGLFVLFFSFLPLILFDLFHSGVNLGGLNQYFSETRPHQGWNLSRFWEVLVFVPQGLSRLIYLANPDLTSIYTYCRQLISTPPVLTIITLIILITFAVLFWRHRHQPAYWLLGSYFFLLLIGLNFYGNFFSSDLFNHYLATLFPLFFLITAVLLDRLFTPIKLSLMITLVGFNLVLFSQTTTQDSFRLKRQAVDWALEQVGHQPFTLDSLSSCFRYNGTRYLFTLAGQEPAQSFVDSNFSWLYQMPLATSYAPVKVVFVHQDFTGPLPPNIISRRNFGSWEVLILRYN